jgi:hypothetical protein
MKFIVYGKNDGSIRRMGTCPSSMLEAQAMEDEVAMEFVWKNENRVIDGVPVRIEPPAPPDPTEEEKEEKERAEYEAGVRERTPALLLDLENRVRALEGKVPLTEKQFVEGIRNKVKE